MRKILFTLLLLIPCLLARSQKAELFYDLNFGVPEATGLRTFHAELADQVPLSNFETTDNFYYYYGYSVGVRVLNRVSLYFNQRVSGAKTSLADYSGYFRLTNELRGNTYGARYDFFSRELSKGRIYFSAKGMVTTSALILKTAVMVNDEAETDQAEFKSLDLGIGAGINYEYPFRVLIVRAYVELDLVYGGKIRLKGDTSDDGYLMNSSGNKVTTGWSGLNAGLGLSLPLAR
ncbi:MAG: hypothetical protein V2I54_07440 [Bacteroidales bacterium]|jgi:hypothetical protein|nr:hypothetical protein [Bacteroidales bacterium]